VLGILPSLREKQRSLYVSSPSGPAKKDFVMPQQKKSTATTAIRVALLNHGLHDSNPACATAKVSSGNLKLVKASFHTYKIGPGHGP